MKTLTTTKLSFLCVLGILLMGEISFAQNSSTWRRNQSCSEETPRYSYYPNQEVYYDHQERVYRYYENDCWNVSVRLPKNLGSIQISNEPVVYTDRVEIHTIRYPEIYISERTYYGPSERSYYKRGRGHHKHCH